MLFTRASSSAIDRCTSFSERPSDAATFARDGMQPKQPGPQLLRWVGDGRLLLCVVPFRVFSQTVFRMLLNPLLWLNIEIFASPDRYSMLAPSPSKTCSNYPPTQCGRARGGKLGPCATAQRTGSARRAKSTPARAIALAVIPLKSRSPNWIMPAKGTRPEMALNKVVLPAPFSPIIDNNSPSFTCKLISLRARALP